MNDYKKDYQADGLRERWNAAKLLTAANLTVDETAKVAQFVKDKHKDGSLTLVIVNTVDRSRELFDTIRKLYAPKKPKGRGKSAALSTPTPTPDLKLIHSRFRPKEREAWRSWLTQGAESLRKDHPLGRIVVSTQVVEAGVDLSARTLITELAPWPSLDAALFGSPAPRLQETSVDQFDPGKAGGANGTQGMEASPMLNPWEYVLMLEGALVLSGNTSRRLGAGRVAASFPFVVDSSPAGHGSVGVDSTRGEAWLPLWSAPALFGEVKQLLSEGRAEVGRVRAWSGLTFAQAVAGLGVDRGIRSFVKYEFQERLGQSYIATPVGRFDVPEAPQDGIELVRALNQWLESYRFACRTKQEGAKVDPPPRFPTSLRRIEAGIFDFCKYGGADRLAAILAALGNAERQLALGDCKPKKRRTRWLLGGLSAGWLMAANGDSSEFNLARGLAFLEPGKKGTGPLRQYLEPVEYNSKFRSWSWGEGGGHVVWGGVDIARNLSAVIIRRFMDAEKNGEPLPPFDSPFPVRLADIVAFLNGDTDDRKVEELLWGLSLVERETGWEVPKSSPDAVLPRAYALMKLTLLPGRLD